ncbi:MAG: hypothetical protein K2N05_09075 [Muribaculaceae bacterium]|nr:hypothetical protein [Muribaculaceae bacterium]
MEIEQSIPATDPGKIFIEVDPDTARGIEAMKQIDEAFNNLIRWIESVWGNYDYPYYREAVKRWLEVDKWGMGVLTTLIGGTLDATDFKSI